MRILFLSRWYPYPPSNGSKLRIYNLLRGLAQKHELTLLSFVDQPDAEPNLNGLQSLCSKIHIVPWKPFEPGSKQAVFGFFSAKPRSVIDTFSPQMKQCLESLLAENHYDLVIASQVDMAAYSPYFQGVPAIFEELEVGVLYERFYRGHPWQHRLRNGLTWFKHRRYLSSLLQNFQAGTVVSHREKQYLAQEINNPTPIKIIPNCVQLADYKNIQEEPQPNTLIFIGAFSYSPNYEAMQWFLRDVWPIVLNQVDKAQLSITGNHGNRPLPSTKNVTLTGFVDDIRPLVARAWASIVPLQEGGGTRLKILEAMALGTPVIATSKGAEGLDAEPDKHLLIADTPQDFAQAVVKLLNNAELRQELSGNAFELMRTTYDWDLIMPRFLDLAEQAVQQPS